MRHIAAFGDTGDDPGRFRHAIAVAVADDDTVPEDAGKFLRTTC